MIDKERVKAAVSEWIYAIGDDPNRAGIEETPQRVANMCEELFSDVQLPPEGMLKHFKEESFDEVIVLKGIVFHSICEHHLLPFFGTVDIAYIPAANKLLGISKLARIIDLCSRRLQLQERLTDSIADLLETEVGALGVGVIVKARHLCMEMRGVKKFGAETTTTSFRGRLGGDFQEKQYAIKLLTLS